MEIRMHDLKHDYLNPTGEAHSVLDIPGWTIPTGKQVLLRGVSGSGKTTLFNIMAGLLHPTGGTVYFGDQLLYDLTEAQRDHFRAQHIGYIFQQHFLIQSLSALENVRMPMRFANRLSPAQATEKAVHLLEKVGLKSHLHHRPKQLSMGQRLRVSIARALANPVSLVLADEPTAALDPSHAHDMIRLIRENCESMGATLVMASHDPSVSLYFSTIMDLKHGQLLQHSSEVKSL